VPSLPEALDRAVMSAIARDPSARPNSALELQAMLRSAA